MDDFYSCDRVWDLLSLYADGEASLSERDAVERHVSLCETCALDLQFMRETASVLAQAPVIAPPPGLKQAILAATIYRPSWQERVRQTFANMQPARLQAAGGALAVLLIGILVSNGLHQPLPMVEKSGGPAVASRAPVSANVARTAQPDRPPAAGDRLLANSDKQDTRPDTAQGPHGDQERIQAGPTKIAHIEGGPHLTPAVVTSRPMPRKQSIRIPDESRVAAVPAPRAADESPLNEPADMREVTGSTGLSRSEIAKNDAGNEKLRDSDSSEPPAAPHTRYTLTSGVPAGGSDALVSFAELRSALRKRNEPVRTVALDLHANDRNALWDVYKSRF